MATTIELNSFCETQIDYIKRYLRKHGTNQKKINDQQVIGYCIQEMYESYENIWMQIITIPIPRGSLSQETLKEIVLYMEKVKVQLKENKVLPKDQKHDYLRIVEESGERAADECYRRKRCLFTGAVKEKEYKGNYENIKLELELSSAEQMQLDWLIDLWNRQHNKICEEAEIIEAGIAGKHAELKKLKGGFILKVPTQAVSLIEIKKLLGIFEKELEFQQSQKKAEEKIIVLEKAIKIIHEQIKMTVKLAMKEA